MAPLLTPQFALFMLAVFAVLGGLAYALMPDHNRRVRCPRLNALVPQPEAAGPTIAQAGKRQLGTMGRWLGASPLVGAKEQAKMIAFLASAGIKGRDLFAIFLASKALLGLGMIFGGLVVANAVPMLHDTLAYRLATPMAGGLLGWRLPDLLVSQIAARRRQMLTEGIADALDLLVICVEAGLGLEAGLDRVSRDIKRANAVVAEELAATVAEMKVLPQVRDALDNLAKRSGSPMIKSIVTTFVQSIQYGTPLAQALRVLAAEMRQHRLLQIEERAARLPVMMTVPLILFILPCLFLVVGGPAILQLMDVMKH